MGKEDCLWFSLWDFIDRWLSCACYIALLFIIHTLLLDYGRLQSD